MIHINVQIQINVAPQIHLLEQTEQNPMPKEPLNDDGISELLSKLDSFRVKSSMILCEEETIIKPLHSPVIIQNNYVSSAFIDAFNPRKRKFHPKTRKEFEKQTKKVKYDGNSINETK